MTVQRARHTGRSDLPGQLAADPLMTPAEVADYWAVNIKTVRSWRQWGQLAPVPTPTPHLYRYRLSEVTALRVSPVPAAPARPNRRIGIPVTPELAAGLLAARSGPPRHLNALLLAAFEDGWTLRSLAAELDVSKQRISLRISDARADRARSSR